MNLHGRAGRRLRSTTCRRRRRMSTVAPGIATCTKESGSDAEVPEYRGRLVVQETERTLTIPLDVFEATTN